MVLYLGHCWEHPTVPGLVTHNPNLKEMHTPQNQPHTQWQKLHLFVFENLRFNQQSLEVSTLTIIVMNGIRWTCTMYACIPYLVLFIFTFLDFNCTVISTVHYQFWQHLQLHIRHPPNASNLMIKVPRLLPFTIQPYLSFFNIKYWQCQTILYQMLPHRM
jgi:hypothetical protein